MGFNPGTIQKLKIVKKESFGVYLAESENDTERVLLPRKQVKEGAAIGDTVEVFLYRDSDDRPIATVNRPALTLHTTARLRVVGVSRIGAFLDMGLERDLFLPYKEQTRKVSEGEEVLVAMYVDKSSRLCATMKLYHYLESSSPYRTGDNVSGTLYEITRDFGAYVAIDDKYSARIPKRELTGALKVGEKVSGRVTRVLDDGKLDISLREKAYLMLDEDAERILRELKDNGGVLSLSDSSSPEEIRERLGMSKGAFKRAIGHLYKDEKIVIKEYSIELI
ncbi:MAG: RNA-binding protein [Lachnospiraceae bacterium]|nr:RNA-binding protein [Lachnospiraceae bacterium]